MTRDEMPPVPAGKVRLADCGTYPRELDADFTLMDCATGALSGYPTVRLVYVTRGYVIAGSCMRWGEARWSVTWDDQSDNTIQGRSFLASNEAGARAYFAELTDYETVSKRRQEDAWLEDTVWAPARAERAAREAERVAAEKARKAARRKSTRISK